MVSGTSRVVCIPVVLGLTLHFMLRLFSSAVIKEGLKEFDSLLAIGPQKTQVEQYLSEI